MLLPHWGLTHDPFAARSSSYVATPGHEEAVARIVHMIDGIEPLVELRAAAGLGKTAVFREALSRARGPRRRIASLSAPVEGAALWTGLARSLGGRPGREDGRPRAWQALESAVRVCRVQRLHVILAIDDDRFLVEPGDLDRLVHLDPHPGRRLTVLRAGPPRQPDPSEPSGWRLSIRLPRLSRDETEGYLRVKLSRAGRALNLFTSSATTRIHQHSEGVPLAIDRLASLALLVGADRGLERIDAGAIDGVAAECTGWSDAA